MVQLQQPEGMGKVGKSFDSKGLRIKAVGGILRVAQVVDCPGTDVHGEDGSHAHESNIEVE